MAIRGRYICNLVLVVYLVQSSVIAAPAPGTMEADTTVESKDGQRGKFLFELGTNFSNPLLRLLGKTFESYEDDMRKTEERLRVLCQLHPCSEWESWTKCPVARGYSMVTRTRTCNRAKGPCGGADNSELPTLESKVCEASCPYNITDGYCIQVFTTKLAQYDAQEACLEDGAHLVNIDTKKKFDAYRVVLKSHGVTFEDVWINGNRTSLGGDWQYTYGYVPDFDNWASGEPSHPSLQLCKVDEGTDRTWWDRECKDLYVYACEWVQ